VRTDGALVWLSVELTIKRDALANIESDLITAAPVEQCAISTDIAWPVAFTEPADRWLAAASPDRSDVGNQEHAPFRPASSRF
jgi:hypothetical protein